MNQNIHCLVSDCHYWNTGNKCVANEILVVNDTLGQSLPDKMDVTMAKQMTPATAGSCMSTCCKSYVTKGSDKINIDGVKRMS